MWEQPFIGRGVGKMSIEKEGGEFTNLLEESFKNAEIFIRLQNGEEKKVGNFIVERRELRRDKRRPDIVLWIDMSVRIFEEKARVRVPVLIELEKTGLNSAKEDFERFFDQPEIETTAVVLGGDKAIRSWEGKTEPYDTKIVLHIRQIPKKSKWKL